jgi:hypothetical protein
MLYILDSNVCSMVNKATVKVYVHNNRHTINLPSDFVKDSAFPFEIKEELEARIEGERIIIEKKRD